MPSDVGDMYPFVGRSFGNKYTCGAQGFLTVLGWLLVIMSNCVLNLYYACTFYFGMSETKANRRLLPIALVLSLSLTLPVTILYLASGYFSPQPFGPFCMLGPYPDKVSCEKNEDGITQCIAEGLLLGSLSRAFIASVLCIVFIAIVTSLLLVVYATYRVERHARRVTRVREQENEHIDEDYSPLSTTAEAMERTRTALREALMYIAAFLLTWIWLFISMIVGDTNGSPTFWAIIFRFQIFFQPLQGFFNAAIFVYHKVCLTRKVESNLSTYEALHKVLRSPSEVPELILAQMDLVGSIEDPQDDPTIVAPAIIPPDFESIKTPSHSAVLSSNGLSLSSPNIQQSDLSQASDALNSARSTPTTRSLRPTQKYYSMPQGWWEVDDRHQKLSMATSMAQKGSDLVSDV